MDVRELRDQETGSRHVKGYFTRRMDSLPLLPVTVVGAGSWGTAAAALVASSGAPVHLWCRRSELCHEINARRTNDRYLPDFALPPSLSATADLAAAIDVSPLVVMAVPSHAFREVFREAVPSLREDAVVVSLSKGVEQATLKRM